MAFTVSDFAAYKKASKQGKKKLASMLAGKMIVANDRLIRRLVQKYSKHLPDSIDREDLLQAGYVGTMRLFERLECIDPKRKVSTLLAFYVRSEIGKLAERNPVVRKPITATMPWKAQSRVIAMQAQGIEPSAALLGVTERLWEVWQRETPKMEQAYEDSLGGEGDPESLVSERQQKNRLLIALSELESAAREVIVWLYSDDEATPRQVAKRLRVPERAVLEIRDRALDALREALEDS